MIKAIYIHIPFCYYKCPYCDFLSVVESPISKQEYIKALFREFELYKDLEACIETVYFGGGTPSLLSPDEIGKILERLYKTFDLSRVKEITLECNPETYREMEFKKIKELGINRISIGVQSFTEKGLKILGRKHTLGDTYRCLESVFSSGLENVNVDLIWGFPSQNEEDLYREFEELEKFPVKHISTYLLTLYDDTPMGISYKKGKFKLPEEEKIDRFHKILSENLKRIGFERYEISNWAKEGYECKHNLVYWKMEEFLGFGVSAWGFYENNRYGNTRNIYKYFKLLEEKKTPIEHKVQICGLEFEKEKVMLGLRLTEGIENKYLQFVPEYIKEFMEVKNGRLRIKEEFLLTSNEIIAEILKNMELTFNEV